MSKLLNCPRSVHTTDDDGFPVDCGYPQCECDRVTAAAISVDLKPCPFCGGEAIKCGANEHNPRHWIMCRSCHACPVGDVPNLQGAITAWNTRAYEPDQARIAELETALRNIAEGNLGDNRWQANYARIKQVARAALEKRHD